MPESRTQIAGGQATRHHLMETPAIWTICQTESAIAEWVFLNTIRDHNYIYCNTKAHWSSMQWVEMGHEHALTDGQSGSGSERVVGGAGGRDGAGFGATCRHASLGRHAVDIGRYSMDVEQGNARVPRAHAGNTMEKSHIMFKKNITKTKFKKSWTL